MPSYPASSPRDLKFVIYEKKGHVAHVTINRPEVRNAVQAAVRLYRLTAAFPPSLAAYARDLDQQVAESEDGAEGPRAFRERRRPVWKMR
jgi:enoyl-CoA hydratase/carnithine racemase